MRENIVLVIPLVIAVVLIATIGLKDTNVGVSSLVSSFLETVPTGLLPSDPNSPVNVISGNEDSEVCTCPLTGTCSVVGDAVLGGVDVVQYFTDFLLTDGSYNESEVGKVGSSEYSSTYQNYSFYFLSDENKAIFDASPSTYVPQWGGFCAWGVSGEYCPPYPWSADCLGPSGNWGHWTIQNDKLYFFLFDEAKEKFMNDTDTNIAAGDSRWASWFGEGSYYSTSCYVE